MGEVAPRLLLEMQDCVRFCHSKPCVEQQRRGTQRAFGHVNVEEVKHHPQEETSFKYVIYTHLSDAGKQMDAARPEPGGSHCELGV